MSDTLFCDGCGGLLPPNAVCKNNKCPEYTILPPPRVQVIPLHVDSYKEVGILGFYGYTLTIKEEKRRNRLLQLYVDLLVHSGGNREYVEAMGHPSSDTRVRRIISILDGLNEFTPGDPNKRKNDSEFLDKIHKNKHSEQA